MYMFTWTVVSDYDSRYISDMYMNDDVIASGWSNINSLGQSSNVVFIHCDSGSRVYIQCGPTSSQNCWPHPHSYHGLNTFSGFMLAAEVVNK